MDFDQLAEHLPEILEILRDSGATQFSCPVFSVVLGPPLPTAEAEAPLARPGELIRVRPGSSTVVGGLYQDPALWSGGVPPTFPKKEA